MTGGGSSSAEDAHRLVQAGRLDEAAAVAERAVKGALVCLPGHAFLASILLKLGRADRAEGVIAHAVTLKVGAADAYDGLAFVSMNLRKHERANELYRRATKIAPGVPRYWYNLACSERSFGRLAEAKAACDRSIALDQAQYPTYLLRSELRVQTPDANHIVELRLQLERPNLEDRARFFLGYALAKELDDIGRFDEAFAWFASAAGTRRTRLQYDVAGDERKLRRIAEVFPKALIGSTSTTGPDAAHLAGSRYIFIVGLPRSGTTLLERILTGLPGVRSNGETENISRALLAAARGEGDVFQRVAAADPATVAANYARFAKLGDDHHVIEKLPMNYLYVGAIRRAMPTAKIILVSRSPLDSCFAMYRTLFGEAYPFSYDLEELGRYYAAYENLMVHWRAALGDGLCEVVYEELVREPKRVGAFVARHCGLAWTDDAVDIEHNQSVSLTASAAQVRRPIYGTSSGRWRHYRRHLQGLIATLRKHGVSLPDDINDSDGR